MTWARCRRSVLGVSAPYGRNIAPNRACYLRGCLIGESQGKGCKDDALDGGCAGSPATRIVAGARLRKAMSPNPPPDLGGVQPPQAQESPFSWVERLSHLAEVQAKGSDKRPNRPPAIWSMIPKRELMPFGHR